MINNLNNLKDVISAQGMMGHLLFIYFLKLSNEM